MAARPNEALQSDTASIKSAAAIDYSGGNVALPNLTRGLYVGVTGNVTVIFANDTTAVLLTGLAAGVWHPMQIQQVNQSGTTATGLVAGY